MARRRIVPDLLRIIVRLPRLPAMVVVSVPAVHENMHQWAGEDHEHRQSCEDMLLVPDHKITCDDDRHGEKS